MPKSLFWSLICSAVVVAGLLNSSELPDLSGSEFLLKSVNIFNMNPLQGMNDPGFGGNIFLHKYSRNCHQGGNRIPDAICSNFTVLDNTNFVEDAGHIHDAQGYQAYVSKYSTFQKSVSIGNANVDFADVSVSASNDFQAASAAFASEDFTLVIKRAVVSAYRATMSDYMAPNKKGYVSLDEDFEMSVIYDLTTEYNAQVYVGWLLKYGTHYIKSLIAGATITEQAGFKNTQYAKMEGEVDDVEVAAQASAMFHGSQSASGSASESAAAETYDSYAKGFLRISNHGAIPKSDAFDSWLDEARKNAVPVGMDLAPIFEILTKDWFPNDPDIALKQENMARAVLDFCNVTGTCYQPPQPKKMMQFVFTANTTIQSTMLLPANNTFCYLTRVSALHDGDSRCSLSIYKGEYNDTSSYWYLTYSASSSTSVSATTCGAHCFRALEHVDYEKDIQFYSQSGSGKKSVDIGSAQSTMCFLAGGSAWGLENSADSPAYCSVHYSTDNLRWVLEAYGTISGFSCNAVCIDRPISAAYSAPILGGVVTGEVTQVLKDANQYQCFLGYLRYILQDDVGCYLQVETVRGMTGLYWVQRYYGTQSITNCGASCVGFQ